MKKKKLLTLLLVIILVPVVLIGIASAIIPHGKTNNVNLWHTESEQYSDTEINDAMDCVIRIFKSSFGGCELLDLWYDESFAENDETENRIVLLCNFYVDSSGGQEGCWNPDDTYNNYSLCDTFPYNFYRRKVGVAKLFLARIFWLEKAKEENSRKELLFCRVE